MTEHNNRLTTNLHHLLEEKQLATPEVLVLMEQALSCPPNFAIVPRQDDLEALIRALEKGRITLSEMRVLLDSLTSLSGEKVDVSINHEDVERILSHKGGAQCFECNPMAMTLEQQQAVAEAKGVLVVFRHFGASGTKINRHMTRFYDLADEDADVIFQAVEDPTLAEKQMRVVVVLVSLDLC